MKKTFFMGLLLVIVLTVGLCTVSAANAWDYVVAEKFEDQDGENYWGPYGPAYMLMDGALVFDNSIANGWVTLNFKDERLAKESYRYVVISVKTDNPADAQGVILTFGNVKKPFSDWGIKLSNTYTVYVLDLSKHGFTAWGDGAKSIPDFALNVVPGKNFALFINQIKLTNNPDGDTKK